MKRGFTSLLLFLLVMPASTTYEMRDFAFGGGGGTATSSSTNYAVNGTVGEVSGDKGVGSNYNLGPGLLFTQQANVPVVPTFTNPANHYNKLKIILDNGGNASDTGFAIAISPDGFTTTYYVQADHTIGPTLNSSNYLTYSAWGSGTGFFIIGLTSGTTYSVKVKAMQGNYTETEYTPVVTASTVMPSLTYDIDVSPTDSSTSPPYIVNMGSLAPGVVTTATDKVWVSLDTNAENGAFVYAYDSNNGLRSTNAGGYTIAGVTGDLSVLTEGYGLRVASAAQTSGGPLAAVSPFNGATDNVGIVDTSSRTIFNTSGAAIVGGRGSVFVKAKARSTTPAAGDYADTITMIASASF